MVSQLLGEINSVVRACAFEQHTKQCVYDYYGVLQDVPADLMTPAMCVTGLLGAREEFDLAVVPDELRDAVVCAVAVMVGSNHGRALAYVPDELITAELCLAAVSGFGLALAYVPDELKSVEICAAAVASGIWSPSDIPSALRHNEAILAAEAAEECECEFARLESVPDAEKTSDVCAAYVAQCGYDLKYVPQNLKTYAMCLAAFRSEDGVPPSLGWVPEEFRTATLCAAAVAVYGPNLRYVPRALKTDELCMMAVSSFWHRESAFGGGNRYPYDMDNILQHVPLAKKTAEMCMRAVSSFPADLEYVPNKLKTAGMCYVALNGQMGLEEFVPRRIMKELLLVWAEQDAAWEEELGAEVEAA